MSRFAGVRIMEVAQSIDGAPEFAAVERALSTDGGVPSVLCVENTCMLYSGNALAASTMGELARLADGYGAHVHLDGARLANASVALGVSVAELSTSANSVTFCLSKGLGAPAGALLGGTAEFIASARDVRQQLGGTMHQSGVLAAAGLEALGRIPELAADHELAGLLMSELCELDGVDVIRPPNPTNIVIVRLPGLTAEELRLRLSELGVFVLPIDDDYVRFVVHREHDVAGIYGVVQALDAIRLRY